MNYKDTKKRWKTVDRFLEIRSHWFTLVGEYLQDEREQILEYWRIEKADSALVLPIQNQQIILPPPTYRPGVGKLTLDFPGGRIPEGKTPEDDELLKALICLQCRSLLLEWWLSSCELSNISQ